MYSNGKPIISANNIDTPMIARKGCTLNFAIATISRIIPNKKTIIREVPVNIAFRFISLAKVEKTIEIPIHFQNKDTKMVHIHFTEYIPLFYLIHFLGFLSGEVFCLIVCKLFLFPLILHW